MRPASPQRFVLIAAFLIVLALTIGWWFPVTSAIPDWVQLCIGLVLAVAVLLQYKRTGKF